MGNLGIKWQGQGERGSGGAGGLGGSGRSVMGGGKMAGKKQKTPGQMLMLKTSAQLNRLLNEDPATVEKGGVGGLIHKSIKSMLERQKRQKRKAEGEMNGMRRVQQMKRKPWLAVGNQGKR